MKPRQLVLRLLGAGGLGVLSFLFVNTAGNMMQSCGSSNFVSWFGSKVHEKVIQVGDNMGQKAYRGPEGEDNWTMLAPHLKLKYYLGPGMIAGFIIGALVGAALVGWERFRQARAPDPVGGVEAGEEGAAGERTGELILPAHWPLIIALLGVFFHGYLLGFAAVLLAGRTRARPWVAWTTRVSGAGVVFFWGVGTEMWWGPGWSTMYRGLANVLKVLFSWVGME